MTPTPRHEPHDGQDGKDGRDGNDAESAADGHDGWFDWEDGPWVARVLDLGGWDASGPDDDLPEHDDAPLETPDAVLTYLLGLVGPDRAGPPGIWFAVLDGALRPLPAFLPLVHVPTVPDVEHTAWVVANLARTVHEASPGGGVAIGLVRPDGGDRGGWEAGWAQALRDAADDVDLRVLAIAAIGASRARVLEW